MLFSILLDFFLCRHKNYTCSKNGKGNTLKKKKKKKERERNRRRRRRRRRRSQQQEEETEEARDTERVYSIINKHPKNLNPSKKNLEQKNEKNP